MPQTMGIKESFELLNPCIVVKTVDKIPVLTKDPVSCLHVKRFEISWYVNCGTLNNHLSYFYQNPYLSLTSLTSVCLLRNFLKK